MDDDLERYRACVVDGALVAALGRAIEASATRDDAGPLIAFWEEHHTSRHAALDAVRVEPDVAAIDRAVAGARRLANSPVSALPAVSTMLGAVSQLVVRRERPVSLTAQRALVGDVAIVRKLLAIDGPSVVLASQAARILHAVHALEAGDLHARLTERDGPEPPVDEDIVRDCLTFCARPGSHDAARVLEASGLRLCDGTPLVEPRSAGSRFVAYARLDDARWAEGDVLTGAAAGRPQEIARVLADVVRAGDAVLTWCEVVD